MSELVDLEAWRSWLRSPRGVRILADWTTDHPTLADWSAEELARPRWTPEVDRLQHDLVARAQAGDDRAATTLLVQLRPALERLIRARQQRWGETRAEAIDEVRSAFYETLCRHRLDRRPRRIAANLALDTRQRLDRAAAGSRRPPPSADLGTSAGADGAGDRRSGTGGRRDGGWGGDDGPLAEIAAGLVLAPAIERLPGSTEVRAQTAEAAVRAWLLDHPHRWIAEDLGLERATVRTRLHRLRAVARRQWEEAA